MKHKGFTLIELLIIMVVVGLLVTMALPKYKTAMEKGRSLEGVANAAAISDAANAYYIRNGNSYGTAAAVTDFAIGSNGNRGLSGVTNSKFFDIQALTLSTSGSSQVVTVTLKRDLGTKSYTLVWVNTDGDVSDRYCTGYKPYCVSAGAMKQVGSESKWQF